MSIQAAENLNPRDFLLLCHVGIYVNPNNWSSFISIFLFGASYKNK